MFESIIDYINTIKKESHVISSIIRANYWSKNYSDIQEDVVIVPLYMFHDDLETGNALGSHAGSNKFGGTYFQIACLPPHIASRLKRIIFAMFVHTESKKKSTNKEVFQPVITEINELQNTGIIIKTAGGLLKRVKFKLILTVGDNMGLNGIHGFVESFKSTYFCRICKASAEMCSKIVSEDECPLSTHLNYELDVMQNDSKLTGIKEPSAFHGISDFHITENSCLDVMHDVLEGVCVYVIRSVISDFI